MILLLTSISGLFWFYCTIVLHERDSLAKSEIFHIYSFRVILNVYDSILSVEKAQEANCRFLLIL